MTTKKIVIIVAVLVVAIGLVIAVFVGGIVGFALYSLSKSEAATTARDFLRNNEPLKQDIGEIKDFGSLVTGKIGVQNNDGNATLNMKVIGDLRTVNVTVELMYRSGGPWRVTAASYKNEAGLTVDLLNPYESQTLIPLLVA